MPPWHWSRAAIDSLVAGNVIVGFPSRDPDLALNAVVQVYESFAHAAHPQARAWAERFLTSLPVDWPQPLVRSRLRAFRFDNPAVRLDRNRGTVSIVTTIVVRADGSTVTRSNRITVEVRRTEDGRWRANYASLVSAHPLIFR